MVLDIEKELEIHKEFIQDFAFINPNTMNLCNFKIGSALAIEYLQGGQIVHSSVTCWPLISLPIDKIALSKQSIFVNNLSVEATIRRIFSILNQKKFHVTQISLNLLLTKGNKNVNFNDTDSKLLVDYIKEIYLNKFISKSQLLIVTFMGQRLVFEIVTLVSNEKISKQEFNLNEKFEKQLKISSIESSPSAKVGLSFNEVDIKPIDSLNESTVSLYLVDKNTNFKILNMKASVDVKEKKNENLIKFEDIGGLNNEIELIKDLFIYPFELTTIYQHIGIH